MLFYIVKWSILYFILILPSTKSLLGDFKSFHIVEEITPSVIEDVSLSGEVEVKATYKLRPPNWDNIDTKYVGKTEPVELSSWNDLLTTSSVTSQQLIDKYFENKNSVSGRLRLWMWKRKLC